MAIFDKEKQFYSRPAAQFEPDRPLIYRFGHTILHYVYIVNVPVSVLAYLFDPYRHSGNTIGALAYIVTVYFGLIAVPMFIAAVIASPALLVGFKSQNAEPFNRIFKPLFGILYVLIVLSALVGPALITSGR